MLFVHNDGTTGVIQNDFSIEAEKPVSTEVQLFVEAEARIHDELPPTVVPLGSQFLIELYTQTSVRKVEPVSIQKERMGTPQ